MTSPFVAGPDGKVQIHQHVLRRWRVSMAQMVSPELARDLRCDVLEDVLYRTLLIRLATYVLTDQVVNDSYTCHYDVPASWWQHFKRDCLPKVRHRWVPLWLWDRYARSRLFMVEQRHLSQTVRFERYAAYPRANFPTHERLGDAVVFEQVTPLGWREAAP